MTSRSGLNTLSATGTTLAIKRRLAAFTTVVATNPRVISEAILDEFDRDMTAAATSPYNITVHLPERHRSQQT